MDGTYTYSKDIAEAINRFFKKRKWEYDFEEEYGRFRFRSLSEGLFLSVKYFIEVEDTYFCVYAAPPIGFEVRDKESIPKVAEFICRVNCYYERGSFVLDAEGYISACYHVDCDGIIPTESMIRHSILYPNDLIEDYADGILAVLYTNVSAEEAAEFCKDNRNEELRDIVREQFLYGRIKLDDLTVQLAPILGVAINTPAVEGMQETDDLVVSIVPLD